MMFDPAKHLEQLRASRVTPPADLSLSFLRRLFKQEVERPFKQVSAVSQAWAELVPAELLGHTKLESFGRGVLHVAVDSSARLYELDRLLRAGLERKIVERQRGALRKVRLRVARWE